jgi:hypothetical protein
MDTRGPKFSAVTIFLICGTISTFGIVFILTQPTNSWVANTSRKDYTTENSSTLICSHSQCLLVNLSVFSSTSRTDKRINWPLNKARPLISFIYSSSPPSLMPVHQSFNTWGSNSFQAQLILCSREPAS